MGQNIKTCLIWVKVLWGVLRIILATFFQVWNSINVMFLQGQGKRRYDPSRWISKFSPRDPSVYREINRWRKQFKLLRILATHFGYWARLLHCLSHLCKIYSRGFKIKVLKKKTTKKHTLWKSRDRLIKLAMNQEVNKPELFDLKRWPDTTGWRKKRSKDPQCLKQPH